MAARRDDRRALAQADHQRPWLEFHGNFNRVDIKAVKGGSPTAWEEEVRRLRIRGIAPEELKVYELEAAYQAGNEQVNTLNQQIVQKLNSIASLRRQWFILYVDCGHPKDLKNAKDQMKKLKAKVGRLQNDVRNAGGVPVPVPKLFSTMPIV